MIVSGTCSLEGYPHVLLPQRSNVLSWGSIHSIMFCLIRRTESRPFKVMLMRQTLFQIRLVLSNKKGAFRENNFLLNWAESFMYFILIRNMWSVKLKFKESFSEWISTVQARLRCSWKCKRHYLFTISNYIL